jgi:hypothetical protein
MHLYFARCNHCVDPTHRCRRARTTDTTCQRLRTVQYTVPDVLCPGCLVPGIGFVEDDEDEVIGQQMEESLRQLRVEAHAYRQEMAEQSEGEESLLRREDTAFNGTP